MIINRAIVNQLAVNAAGTLNDSLSEVGLGDELSVLVGLTVRDILGFSEELGTNSKFFTDLADALTVLEVITLGCGISLESSLGVDDELGHVLTFVERLLDTLDLEIAQEERAAFFEVFISSLLVSLVVRERVGLFMEDELRAEDSNVGIITFIERMIDSFGLSHVSGEYAEFFESFLDALAVELAGTVGWSTSISDSLEFVDILAHLAKFATNVASVLALSDAITNVFVLRAGLEDSLSLGESLTTTALFDMLLEDSLVLSGKLTIDGIDYVAWVLNTTLGGFTKYTNYGFNSYMQIGDKLFALADDGVYLIGGADDNGEDISASFRSGLMDFGDAQRKNVRVVYLGAASSGDMLLKATTTRDGERKTDVYKLSPKSSGRIDRMTKELSNARQARYWEFEIENVDGESLEIDEISWRLMLLKTKDY